MLFLRVVGRTRNSMYLDPCFSSSGLPHGLLVYFERTPETIDGVEREATQLSRN